MREKKYSQKITEDTWHCAQYEWMSCLLASCFFLFQQWFPFFQPLAIENLMEISIYFLLLLKNFQTIWFLSGAWEGTVGELQVSTQLVTSFTEHILSYFFPFPLLITLAIHCCPIIPLHPLNPFLFFFAGLSILSLLSPLLFLSFSLSAQMNPFCPGDETMVVKSDWGRGYIWIVARRWER